MGINLFADFENQIKHNYHSQDDVKLHELTFSVNGSIFHIKYNHFSKELEKTQQIAIIKGMDKHYITRAAYRTLSAIEHNLPRESAIFARKKELNNKMSEIIPIHTVDLELLASQVEEFKDNIEVHFYNDEIVKEIESLLGKTVLQSIKDVLWFLIPSLVDKGNLDLVQSTLKICISGDGRNIGRKVKQVIVIFAILNSKFNLYKPSSHFTLILYSGTEKYEILKNIELYFTANWKFLSICLGHKAANSMEFCLWYPIHKSQNGILEVNGIHQDNWTISKDINDICQNYLQRPSHQFAPLFSMIIMLFNEEIWQEIINEMKRIQVQFQFWEDQDTKAWLYILLIGDDKLK
ncbi:13282_t:CDS:2, partial [Gigaspora margarita]